LIMGKPAQTETTAAELQPVVIGETSITTFAMSENEYGPEISIIGLLKMTILSQTQPYVKGVIEPAGEAIVVIDPDNRADQASEEIPQRACVLVTEHNQMAATVRVGVLFDDVSDLLEMRNEMMSHSEQFLSNRSTDFFHQIIEAGGSARQLAGVEEVLKELDICRLRDTLMQVIQAK